MELLFGIFAVVWIVLNLPVPPVGGAGTAKLLIGLLGIVLIVVLMLGVHRLAGG